jgi:hypothetical protein
MKKSGYNTYRGWTQREYQNKRYNINQKDEETEEDRRRDGGTNFILRIKELETRLILHEHDDDDDDYDNTNKRETAFCNTVTQRHTQGLSFAEQYGAQLLWELHSSRMLRTTDR